MTKPTILLFDANWLAYRARFGMPALSVDDQETHIIFKLIEDIAKHCSKFNTNKIAFAFDSRNSKRREIYKQYKFKRNNDRDEKSDEDKEIDQRMYGQVDLIKNKILPSLGFNNIWEQDGYENDDTIAKFCLHNSDKYDIVVVAGDKDFYQILDHCSLYKNVKKQWKLYTKKDLFKELGVTPSQWLEGKFLFGCDSDNISGIKGVGDKKACQYILGNMNPGTKTFKKIKHREEFYRNRNIDLIKLPFSGTKLFEYVDDGVLDMNDFVSMCEEYEFISYLNGSVYETWSELFCSGEVESFGMRRK